LRVRQACHESRPGAVTVQTEATHSKAHARRLARSRSAIIFFSRLFSCPHGAPLLRRGRMLNGVRAPTSLSPGLVVALLALVVIPPGLPAQDAGPTVAVDSRMAAPAWATAQRELIQLNAEAVRVHRARQFDARGYSLATPQWGVGAGADDVTEAIRNWPLAHAVGGPDSIIETWSEVWEAHLRQYTEARVPQVEMARDGMYHKEFTPAYDWEHIGEGLGPFYYYGLSRPDEARHVDRARRYAGF